jgi:hypothetical protein
MTYYNPGAAKAVNHQRFVGSGFPVQPGERGHDEHDDQNRRPGNNEYFR